MVREFGWSRTQVTSGNAISKLVVGPLFGFAAGWIVDRFGPRRLMMAGIVMAGGALIGLAHMTSLLDVLPVLPLQRAGLRLRRAAAEPGAAVALVRPDARQGDGLRLSRASASAATLVPMLSPRLVDGVRLARRAAGPRHPDHRARAADARISCATSLRMPANAAPAARRARGAGEPPAPVGAVFRRPAFYLLAIGSMCSIAAVGGTNQHLKLFLSLDLQLLAERRSRRSSPPCWLSASSAACSWDGSRIACRSKRVMLLIYLLIARSIPLLFLRTLAAGDVRVRGGLRPRPRRRIHDHPAHGGRAVRRQGARAACSA